MAPPPRIAVLGAGVFVKNEYIPSLAEISHLFSLKAIWSRTEESARGAIEIAEKSFPNVECKWGDSGLDEIVEDGSIVAVIVVLAAQVQGENLMADIGDMANFQIIVEIPINSSSPYFSTPWRHSFNGGYILDIGVHFAAVVRMLARCEVTSVSAMTSHLDPTLPPPDNMCSTVQLENGCSGVFVTVVSGKTFKMSSRFVGTKGTLQIELENREMKYGYSVTLFMADRQIKNEFYPRDGVTEELKIFSHDVSQAILKNDGSHKVESRLSFLEGARDVAVLDAMLESGKKQGAPVQVKRF